MSAVTRSFWAETILIILSRKDCVPCPSPKVALGLLKLLVSAGSYRISDSIPKENGGVPLDYNCKGKFRL
jgi:hypothetical protein